MIIQPTKEQTRRVLRKRTYSGEGFGPRSFECIGLGIGLGIGLSQGASQGFSGVFSSLGWTGLEQLFQSDIGLAYDSAMVAAAGNTSTATVTISTIPTTAPCALLVKSTNTLAIGSGATFSLYADGGTTPFMTGVTPTTATPIALTGVGSGVSLTWSAGTSVANDTWKAAQASWVDQAPSPHNASASGTARPIITPGVGGKLGLLGNGTTTSLATLLGPLLAPATTNQYIYLLARMTATPAGNAALVALNGGNSFGIYCTPAPLIVQYNGALVNGSAPTNGTWYLMAAKFVGTTADSMQLGSASPVTGATAGAGSGANTMYYFSAGPGAFFAPCEIMFCAIATSPAPASFRAAITSWCGVTQV